MQCLKKFQSFGTVLSRQISATVNRYQRPRFIDSKTNVLYGGDLSVPTPEGSIGSVLYQRMLRYDRRHDILQVCAETQKEITTKTFLENTVAFAERLKEEGVKKGDFVLLVGSNTLNMNAALMGVLLLAAVPLPISHRTDLDEFHTILRSIKPAFFGCQRKYLYPFRQALIDAMDFNPLKICLLDHESDPTEPEIEGFREFVQGRGKEYDSFRPTEVENPKTELALAMKALTDGAIGRVVGITHHNLNSVIARYDDVDDGIHLRKRIILMVQKVLWMSGIYSLIISCAFGSKLIVMRDFNEEKFLKHIHDYKVTNTYLFSTKWWQLYKHIPRGKYDLSSCTHAYTTDGPLPPNLRQALKDRIGLNPLPGFGITELTGFVLNPENNVKKEKYVGRLLPQVYGKVVSDRNSQKVGPMVEGELCFKGPVVTQGYLNNKRANQNLFDKEGYMLSGQYGYYDEFGDFFIIDRIIHQIKYKNYKISPKELEDIIKSLDPVRDVCVSGIAHTTDGEYPIAFVVPQKGQKLTEDYILTYVNGRVADYKKLRGGVVFLTKIPRFRETGSIKRKLIKKILSKYQMKLDNEKDEPMKTFSKDGK